MASGRIFAGSCRRIFHVGLSGHLDVLTGPGSSDNRDAMTDRDLHSPRRYFIDRVLIGLTIEETFEFETLDSLPPDESGNDMEWEGRRPASTREERWLELYTKHDEAWRAWMVSTSADRQSLTFY